MAKQGVPKRSIIFLLLVAGTWIVCSAQAQPSVCSASKVEIEECLHQLTSAGWEARRDAFYRLLALGAGDHAYVGIPLSDLLNKCPARAENIRLTLIQLLVDENNLVVEALRTGRRFGEDRSNYYADVIAAVASLKDRRSIQALLGAMCASGMATSTLASFAPESLDPVLAKLGDKDPLVRACALFVIQEMLLPANYDKVKTPRLRARIKQAFLKGTKDADAVVRARAVLALAALGDTDVIPVIQELAEHDPFFRPGQADGRKDLYIVRRAAKEALVELRRKATKDE